MKRSVAKGGEVELSTTDSGTVYNRVSRLKLGCSFCRPHRGENRNFKRRNGRKPR